MSVNPISCSSIPLLLFSKFNCKTCPRYLMCVVLLCVLPPSLNYICLIIKFYLLQSLHSILPATLLPAHNLSARVSQFHFKKNFASKQNLAKQKQFRFISLQFHEITKKVLLHCASFCFVSFALFR